MLESKNDPDPPHSTCLLLLPPKKPLMPHWVMLHLPGCHAEYLAFSTSEWAGSDSLWSPGAQGLLWSLARAENWHHVLHSAVDRRRCIFFLQDLKSYWILFVFFTLLGAHWGWQWSGVWTGCIYLAGKHQPLLASCTFVLNLLTG